jgi:hypothetical protein
LASEVLAQGDTDVKGLRDCNYTHTG